VGIVKYFAKLMIGNHLNLDEWCLYLVGTLLQLKIAKAVCDKQSAFVT
jgi:hypothetical protein